MKDAQITSDAYLPLIASKYKSVGIEGLSDAERGYTERKKIKNQLERTENNRIYRKTKELKKNEQVMEEYYNDEDIHIKPTRQKALKKVSNAVWTIKKEIS